MLAPDHEQTPRPPSHVQPHKKGPPPSLRIDTPTQKPSVLVLGDYSASTSSLSSANSELDFCPPFKPSKPRSMRNTKKLSLVLPTQTVSASPSQHLASAENALLTDDAAQTSADLESKRRTSLAPIPVSTISSRLHRKDEDELLSSPYADGPVRILPGIWLGSEDNAQNWKDLKARDIRSILNVAKEVNLPFDLMELSRTLNASSGDYSRRLSGTLYPANEERPAVHYLKLPWSHGQPDLVSNGFVAAMAFVDSALNRGDDVLIHCQCGISRSATVAIALIMRAAALALPSTPLEVLALKGTGFSGAYDYVKQKSNCIGPNMSLIYQLQDYQSTLDALVTSPLGSEQSSISGDSEEEWSRRRRLIEDEQKEETDAERESVEVLQEAYALDKAMEERRVSRRTSASSVGSSVGAGCIWKSIHCNRRRTGSMTSNVTTGSIISESLIEEDEEEQLLGIGGGFDAPSISTRSTSGETTEEETYPSPASEMVKAVPSLLNSCPTARPHHPGKMLLYEEPEPKMNLSLLTAPPAKTSFGFTSRLQFKFRSKLKVKPQVLSSLPPVPSSPNVPVSPEDALNPPRADAARRRLPPPLIISSTKSDSHSTSQSCQIPSQPIYSSVNTPSQTLFVFPPSPTVASATPHMVTVTSNFSVTASQSSFPRISTPRLPSFKIEGAQKRTFIGLAVAPSTPTTACSRVDARGWVGLGSCGS